jgi:hypothetical protein
MVTMFSRLPVGEISMDGQYVRAAVRSVVKRWTCRRVALASSPSLLSSVSVDHGRRGQIQGKRQPKQISGFQRAKDNGNDANPEESAKNWVVRAWAYDRVALAEAFWEFTATAVSISISVSVVIIMMMLIIVVMSVIVVADLRIGGHKNDVDAAIPRAPFDGAIVGDWIIFAVPCRSYGSAGRARKQCLHRNCAAARKGGIDGWFASRVRVARGEKLDRSNAAGQVDQSAQFGDHCAMLWLQFSAIDCEIEQSDVEWITGGGNTAGGAAGETNLFGAGQDMLTTLLFRFGGLAAENARGAFLCELWKIW